MKSLCTKGILFFSLALLVVVFAACTQSKPAVPTPTLIPLANDTVVAPSGAETQAPSDQGGTPVAPADATLVVPPSGGDQTTVPQPGDQTPAAPSGGQVTPIIVEPTLLPTPTTVGDTGGGAQATSAPGGSTGTQPVAGGSCTNPYTVQAGDWFYAIARKCGVSPQDLLAANPSLNPNVLRPGQVMNMPAGTGSGGGNPPPAPSTGPTPAPSTGGGTGTCSNPYTVQRGDTLFSIAQRCGSTVAAISQANGIPSPQYIFTGQQLQIP